jgi:tetratricopeptide (TPR) repeat protein
MTLQILGQVSTAIGLLEEGLRNARESRRLYDLGFVLSVTGGLVRGYRREPEILRLYAEEAIALCEENGFAEWLHQGRFSLGWALTELGQVEQGVSQMEVGIAGSRAIGGHPSQQYAAALLAHSYGKIGRVEDAIAQLSDILTSIETTGQKAQHAEILRLKGEVFVMGGERSQARDCFLMALEVARAQEAKWWELRTLVSLARLLRDANRRDEARTVISEIYNWFTEGSICPI